MGRVLDSDASEAFGRFMVRQVALSDMAPNADDAVLEGIKSPAAGPMAQAPRGLPDDERDELLDRAAAETGRRLRCGPHPPRRRRRGAFPSVSPWSVPSRRSRARGLDGRRAPLVEPRRTGPSAASTTPASARSTTTCGL